MMRKARIKSSRPSWAGNALTSGEVDALVSMTNHSLTTGSAALETGLTGVDRMRFTMPVTGAGLEGIIAAESKICYIDGDAGILSYQGYRIETLAQNASFEEVIFLLWNGRLPKASKLTQLKSALAAASAIPPEATALLKTVPKPTPMA